MEDASLSKPSEAVITGELKTLMSDVIERMRFARMHGLTFNGDRDLYKVLGYDQEITPQQYRHRYLRGGIAGRVIDSFCKSTWRGGWELVEDEDPNKNTAFETAWKELDSRLKIGPTLQKADILAAQGHYAILVLGTKSGDLDSELPKGRATDLIYITPFGEIDAKIQDWVEEGKDPRFGLPKSYTLSRTNFSSQSFDRPAHWSRCIHLAEDPLDNDAFGQPGLERIWNLLDDLDKVTGGGAEAFWLRANQGLQLDINKDMTLSEAEKEALKNQADEYSNQMRRMLRTRGVTVNTLGSDVANFNSPADAILTQIAGAKGIPKRILTGSEMGELASSQDRDNWKDQINGRQTGYAGPFIVRPLVDRLIEYGYLPEPKQYEVRWAQIQVLTEQERLEGAKSWATVNSTQGLVVFPAAEIRDKWYGMVPLTPEQIEEEKALKEATTPPPPPQLAGTSDVEKDSEDEDEDEEEEELRAAEQSELLTVLQSAVESNNTDVIDSIIGVKRTHNRWAAAATSGLIFTDRYDALGIERPKTDQTCRDACEGTGWVPIYHSLGDASPESSARPADETELRYLSLWHEAEEVNPSEDGWHFILCIDCQGSGLRAAGGSGSGNFNHGGRPGQIGGSGSGTYSAIINQPTSAYPIARKDGLDTQELHMVDRQTYTPERQTLHAAIVEKMLDGKTPVENPTATILGGGPASGKSTLVKAQGIGFQNTVLINPDDVKELLPEYRDGVKAGNVKASSFVHEESSYVARLAMAEAAKGKYNLVLDGTGDSSVDRLGGRVATLRNAGHKVVGKYVSLPVEVAIQNADARGAKTGRYVPETYLRETHRNVSNTFVAAIAQGLFDEAEVYDTSIKGQARLAASVKRSALTIHDQDLWNAFVAKGKG